MGIKSLEANYPYALKNQLRAAVHVHDLWVRIREKYQRLPCVQLFLIAGEYEVVLGTGGSRIVDQLELLHQMFSLPFQFPVSRLGATSVSNSDPGIQPPRLVLHIFTPVLPNQPNPLTIVGLFVVGQESSFLTAFLLTMYTQISLCSCHVFKQIFRNWIIFI